MRITERQKLITRLMSVAEVALDLVDVLKTRIDDTAELVEGELDQIAADLKAARRHAEDVDDYSCLTLADEVENAAAAGRTEAKS